MPNVTHHGVQRTDQLRLAAGLEGHVRSFNYKVEHQQTHHVVEYITKSLNPRSSMNVTVQKS